MISWCLRSGRRDPEKKNRRNNFWGMLSLSLFFALLLQPVLSDVFKVFLRQCCLLRNNSRELVCLRMSWLLSRNSIQRQKSKLVLQSACSMKAGLPGCFFGESGGCQVHMCVSHVQI